MKMIYFFVFSILIFCGGLTAQNTAIQFDGNSESITVPYKASLALSPAYTLEAWIFASEWKSLSWQGSIFTNDGQGPDGGFAFRCGDNGKLSLVISVDNVWNEIISPAIMNEKQWHHVAGVVDNGSMRLYIDGQEVASGTYSGTLVNKTTPYTIGESTGFPGRVFDGAIDELRIWNTVRTASQLADNNTVDLSGTEAGLVAYFPMNDGSGTTVTNIVDAACSGTTLEMDDNNWVEGYKLPDFDVSVKNISRIDRIHMKNRPVQMSVDIQNVGTMSISGITATLAIDGTEIVSEVIDLELEAGEAITYVFNTPVSLMGINNPNIEVSISQVDDANALNNNTETTIVTREGSIVNLFDQSQHNFGSRGQLQSNAITLPGDLSNYGQLLLHISVDCPSGGCDPWDQTGKVNANSGQGTFEIARYITPYGIACGPWTVDVTDFKSVLTGDIIFDSFVQVFGQSGWLVTIDLEMIEGTANMPYNRVTPLFQTDYHVYGDPGIDDDIDPVSLTIADNTGSSHIRMHVTGHGQGNTNNAAEFFNATHEVMLNGAKVADHALWKADCASNSCADQAGNWLFPRAGWCPGQEVIPAIFNTTDVASSGQSVAIDYELQEYTNLLNTGYNSSGHTEPHYRIHGVMVEESESRFRDYKNLRAASLGLVYAGGYSVFVVLDVINDGSLDVEDYSVSLFVDGVLVENNSGLIFSTESGGINTIDLGTLGEGLHEVVAVINTNDDTNGDNIITAMLEGLPLSTENLEIAALFSVNPNPTNSDIQIQFEEDLIGGQMLLYSMDGRMITKRDISNSAETIKVDHIGTYMLKVINKNGHTASKKVVVIQ
ncbi:MAG: hypothetical protein ACJATI_001775 [Halioglobus sp.]|jgi:uncharacterized protein YdeI (BOF family)